MLLRWEEEEERASLREKYPGFHLDGAGSQEPILQPRGDVKLAAGQTSLELSENQRHRLGGSITLMADEVSPGGRIAGEKDPRSSPGATS